MPNQSFLLSQNRQPLKRGLIFMLWMLMTVGLLQVAGPAAAGAHKGVGCEVDEPDDVAAERVRVEGLVDYDAHPIIVRQLNKTYPGLDGQPPKVRCSEVACLSES
jgi:hypothetical protein